jgi:hypothetical protein
MVRAAPEEMQESLLREVKVPTAVTPEKAVRAVAVEKAETRSAARLQWCRDS